MKPQTIWTFKVAQALGISEVIFKYFICFWITELRAFGSVRLTYIFFQSHTNFIEIFGSS